MAPNFKIVWKTYEIVGFFFSYLFINFEGFRPPHRSRKMRLEKCYKIVALASESDFKMMISEGFYDLPKYANMWYLLEEYSYSGGPLRPFIVFFLQSRNCHMFKVASFMQSRAVNNCFRSFFVSICIRIVFVLVMYPLFGRVGLTMIEN